MDSEMSMAVMFFLCVTGGFMLLIVFFAIRFTIRSMLKKEERELGIMKALGTDSLAGVLRLVEPKSDPSEEKDRQILKFAEALKD